MRSAVVPTLVAALSVARQEADKAQGHVRRNDGVVNRAKAADAMARRAIKQAGASQRAAEAERKLAHLDRPSVKLEERCNALVCELASARAAHAAEAAELRAEVAAEVEAGHALLTAIFAVGIVARDRVVKRAGLCLTAADEARPLTKIDGFARVLSGCDQKIPFLVHVPEGHEERRKSHLQERTEAAEALEMQRLIAWERRKALRAKTAEIEAQEAEVRDTRAAAEEARQNVVSLERLKEKTKARDARDLLKAEEDAIMADAKARVLALRAAAKGIVATK